MDVDERNRIERDIQRLLVHYVVLNDARRWEELAGLYIESGRMVRPSAPGVPIEGRAAILASLLGRPADRRLRHVCANVEVDVQSDTVARASSTYLIYGGSLREGEALAVLDAGPPILCEFDDALVRTPDGWRFASRIGRMLFQPPRT